MKWWNPFSVLGEVQHRHAVGVCPTCEHAPHRDGPCDVCGDRCHYSRTLNADLSRFADARAEAMQTAGANMAKLIRRFRGVSRG